MVSVGDLVPVQGFSNLLPILMWGGVALLIGLILGLLVYFMIVKGSQKRIIEVDQINRKIKFHVGTDKRNRSHQKQLFIGGFLSKVRKFLPNIQQEDVFSQGGRDVIFLLKDNNGLHHTLRIPTLEQMLKWYKVVHNIDLSEEVKKIKEADTEEEKLTLKEKIQDKLKGVVRKDALNLVSTVYLLPNPLENIEWLADEQNAAITQFGTGLMKHPYLVMFGTLTLCGIIFIITLVVTKML